MRNNQDRLGLSMNQANTQPSQEVINSNEMSFVVPTELIELPSKGNFYEEGHLLHKVEFIEIKHMTTKEEDILTNKSYLKDGSVLDRLLDSVIISPKVKARDILVGDKNALLIACRIHGYGSDYETKFICPSCGDSSYYPFDLLELKSINYEEAMEKYEVSYDEETTLLTVNIPRTKTQLELKILKDDSSKLDKKKETTFMEQYKKIIYSVNGSTDPRLIKSYIESMAAIDSRYLRTVYSKVVPGVDFSYDVTCPKCESENTVEVPLSAEFFWPRS